MRQQHLPARVRRTRAAPWLLVLAIVLALPAVAEAAARRWSQLTEISFQHLTQEQGLPNEIATVVAQDGDGFLWAGTLGGLARWDGYRFKVYKADPRTPGALPDNVVQALHADAAGRLWVGTSAAGLVRYDAETDAFVGYPVGAGGLSHVSVRSIADDGRGGLWIATDAGLDHLDPATGTLRHADAAGASGLGREPVHVLLRDRAGHLWAGSWLGLFRRAQGDNRFLPVPLLDGARQPEPQSLFEDAGGRLWVGTLRHGAFTLGAGLAPARPVRDRRADGDGALLNQQVVGITETRPGEVWLATVSQGIFAVDVASGETRRIQHRPTLPVSLSDNALRSLYRDRAGLIWVAGNRGLSRHDPRQSALLTMFGPPAGDADSAPAPGTTSTEVSWILPMPDGRIWLGTHKSGVEVIDATGARVAALRPDPARPNFALPQDSVIAMARVDDGSVFIATKRGLYRASADALRVERIVIAGREPDASNWALLADGDTLWVGGQTDGLWRFDLAKGTGSAALIDPAHPLSDERIAVLARGPAGQLWVGTRFGLNRYDPVTGMSVRFVPRTGQAEGLGNGFIATLFTDARKRLWVGTYGGGISVIDDAASASPRWQQIGAAQGLPDLNVNALLDDAAGRIWVSTDNGLAIIDPSDFSIRVLKRAEGVVFQTYWSGSAARTSEGELLFGGAGGMTIVRPERLQTWDYRPPVAISELRVGGVVVPAAPWLAVGARDPLPVPANANSLAVEFSAMDFSAPERNRYAYRLDGYDSDWTETDASRRVAAYTNLPPGDYTLQVRGSNRDGVWTERVLTLPVHVLPAWHQTLWFRVAALLALVGVVVAVVHQRTRLLRARQAELERKVGERTAELQRMSDALAEKSRVLERMSTTDPLTGLHNRRFLAEHLEASIAASLRRGQDSRATTGMAPIDADNVFLLIDVDHFKRVNDLLGHAAGDEVLVQVGRRLRSVLRESDYLVRWGGEEFLAVARDTDRDRAEELAERIRVIVSETPFALGNGRLQQLSCSIGFACVPFIARQPRGLGWQDVVALADVALLAAKRTGRDAWVGLHAAPQTRAEGLLARVQADAAGALRSGEIGFTSNRSAPAVTAALAVPRDVTPASTPDAGA